MFHIVSRNCGLCAYRRIDVARSTSRYLKRLATYFDWIRHALGGSPKRADSLGGPKAVSARNDEE
jgi:hypothetical protein